MATRQKFEGISIPTAGGFRAAVWRIQGERLEFQSAQVFPQRERARHAASECALILDEGGTLDDCAFCCSFLEPESGSVSYGA